MIQVPPVLPGFWTLEYRKESESLFSRAQAPGYFKLQACCHVVRVGHGPLVWKGVTPSPGPGPGQLKLLATRSHCLHLYVRAVVA